MCSLVGAGVLSVSSQQTTRKVLPGRNRGLHRRQWAHSQGRCCWAPWLPPELPSRGSGSWRKPGATATELRGLCAGMCLPGGPQKSPVPAAKLPSALAGVLGLGPSV